MSLLSGKEWAYLFVYLDDNLIVSKNLYEHIKHVQRVMIRLLEAGLHLKPDKMYACDNSNSVLGLTPEGVKSNDSKVTAVKEF